MNLIPCAISSFDFVLQMDALDHRYAGSYRILEMLVDIPVPYVKPSVKLLDLPILRASISDNSCDGKISRRLSIKSRW